MDTLRNQEEQLLALRNKAKYIEDSAHFYPGIADPALLSSFTDRIDLSIDDFLSIVRSGRQTREDYLDAIRKGLSRFDIMELDTEDRERTAGYFEEMMDCVGLESSDGLLNDFVY